MIAVLEEIDALPGTEHELAVHDRHRELHLGQGGFQMRRHVVRPLIVVFVESRASGRESVEEFFKVAPHGRRRILLDEQRGRGVTAEECEQAFARLLLFHPLAYIRGDFRQAAAAGADAENMGGLFHWP